MKRQVQFSIALLAAIVALSTILFAQQWVSSGGGTSTTGTATIGGALAANGGISVDSPAFTVANTTGLVSQTASSNAQLITLSTRNSSNGNAASNALQLGNDAAANQVWLSVYGSAHATKPNYFEILQRGAAPLTLGSNNTVGMTFGSDGHASLNTGILREFRSVTTNSTDSNQPYMAPEVLGGIIVRSGLTANRTDILAAASDFVAAISGAYVGLSFTFVVSNQDDASTLLYPFSGNADTTFQGANGGNIVAGATAMFLVVLTNVSPASETMTVYRIG